MRSKAGRNQNKFMRIITLPFRVLGKAGDAYARGLTSCTGRGASSYRGPAPDGLPRSFSAVSSTATSRGNDIANSEDFRELLRAASAKTLEIDVDVAARRGPNVLPKSCSAGMGMRRIDEDESCDFGDDEEVKDLKRRSTAMFPRRSRSYAVRT